MSSDPLATQVNVLRHQRTEIPPNKAKRKQFKNNKFGSKNMEYSNEANHQQAPYKKNEFENKKAFNSRQILHSEDRCHKCGDSKHIEGFQCSAHKYQCRNCHKIVFLVACATRNKNLARRGQDHPKHTNWPVVDYLHKIIPYAATTVIIHQVMNLSACKWSYKLSKLIPMFQHLSICLQIWNLKSSCMRTKQSSREP